MKHTPRKQWRDSDTGQWITEDEAKKNPKQSERETVYYPSPKRD